ncbi:mpv17-like protein [Varroa jacobsoni]|uniref:Mpv17-like protein n=1 Tax=Varroa destructor TaxID=109461 RepID=A0A7M7JNU4_VARDE|nr:mpv17-like protein [Varroa destructor]XP_022695885.1 mpv17-like protein [Varroa jacobsoni]
MSGLFSKVRAVFRARPLVANATTYTAMICAAEFTQQTILKRYEPDRRYDFTIIGRYFVIGSCIYGPTLFHFYRILDRALPAKTVAVSLTKAVVDQAVLSSSLLAVFYTAMSVMEGEDDVFAEMKAKWWPTYKLSCLFWVPVQCCNFLFMPPPARVVTVGVCSFVWVNILCLCKRGMAIKSTTEKSEEKSPESATLMTV